MTLNLALFGLGRAGKIHYNNILQSKLYNLKAIIDIEFKYKEHFPNNTELIQYKDDDKIDKLLQSDTIDAVIIASPTNTHYDIIIRSLQANKHVFVEKPIVNNLNKIKECFRLANQRQLKLFVGYNRRFDYKIQDIKHKIDTSNVGKINYITTTSRDYPYPSDHLLASSGGIFHDCATHDIDYVNWIVKEKPLSVNVVVDDEKKENFNYDHVTITMKYASNCIAVLNLSRISSNYDQRCEIYCQNGEVLNNDFEIGKKTSFPYRYKKAFKLELEEFYSNIVDDTDCLVTEEDCISNFLIAEACEQSTLQKKAINIKYMNEFRQFNLKDYRISQTYKLARENQTVDFVLQMKNKYKNLDNEMEFWDALVTLNKVIDQSDPDTSMPNLTHAIQTAEMIRKDGLPDWFQLIGLIHDLGKIMFLKGDNKTGTGLQEQWAMVGDTFIVGCKLPDTLVYSEFNHLNLDKDNQTYNTDIGMYHEKCGLDNVHCSWGHDEYLYMILASDKNKNTLPDEALHIVRYHSLYAYHDKNEYKQFESEKDKNMLNALQTFNKYDLYSKSNKEMNIEEMKQYYSSIFYKYFNKTTLFF